MNFVISHDCERTNRVEQAPSKEKEKKGLSIVLTSLATIQQVVVERQLASAVPTHYTRSLNPTPLLFQNNATSGINKEEMVSKVVLCIECAAVVKICSVQYPREFTQSYLITGNNAF